MGYILGSSHLNALYKTDMPVKGNKNWKSSMIVYFE